MKYYFILFIVFMALFSSCSTSGTLAVSSVSYQSLRTDFAQPESIDKGAKIAVEYFFNPAGEMQPVVYNLTSDILIVDQTKSFVIMPNGSSVSYYDPNIHTSTSGTYSSETTGSTFNLGGITSALGIGGPLGSLASATTVGSSQEYGSFRQNSVTIIDQPLVRIGPKGSIAMSKAYTINGFGTSAHNGGNKVDISKNESDLKFSVCITYSLDDGATYEKLVTNFYVSSHITIPVVDKRVSNAFYSIYDMKPDALAERMYLFMISDNIKTETEDIMGGFISHSNVYNTYIQGSLVDFK